MKALILVGGFGTRLRPLTLNKPKPLVPFCNKPMLVHQIEALKEVGVDEVVLAIAYRPDAMKAEMDSWGEKLGVKIHYSHETTPLGTAGPLALAREFLEGGDEPFFVLNSDVTCRFPMKELLTFHKQHKGEGTIMVTKVTEWQKYGVVVYDTESGLIDQFVEKPKKFVGDKINSGIYIFNQSILKRIPLEKTSIETQVFPQMAADKTLFAMELEGFWMDIGQPHDYLDGLGKYLPSLVGSNRESLLMTEKEAESRGFSVIGCVLIDPSAVIGKGCVLGPNVTVDKDCKIGEHCRISQTAILEGSIVECGCCINKSIIGWFNRIGKWCHIGNNTVLGEDVAIKAELYINGAKVLPHKGIGASVEKPEVIM